MKILLLLVLLDYSDVNLLMAQSANFRAIVHYQPEVVQLEGTLIKQAFPGPPNYENIARGDDIERHWYLKLLSPIDVTALNPKKLLNLESDSEFHVKILQLAIDYEDPIWSKLKDTKIGTRVHVKGTLFHRQTGHHHSRVLMEVDAVRFVNEN